MKTICKFKINPYNWSRDSWSNKTAYENIEDIFDEIQSYIGLSNDFDYRDWYGDVIPCKVTIVDIELIDKYGNIVITEEADIEMNDDYMPCPWSIINPNFIKKPENWSEMTCEEKKAFHAQFTFIHPTSCSRMK